MIGVGRRTVLASLTLLALVVAPVHAAYQKPYEAWRRTLPHDLAICPKATDPQLCKCAQDENACAGKDDKARRKARAKAYMSVKASIGSWKSKQLDAWKSECAAQGGRFDRNKQACMKCKPPATFDPRPHSLACVAATSPTQPGKEEPASPTPPTPTPTGNAPGPAPPKAPEAPPAAASPGAGEPKAAADPAGDGRDGPLNADCSVDRVAFEQSWKKYSDLDDRIPMAERSHETRQAWAASKRVKTLVIEQRTLKANMEIDRQMRLEMRAYRDALTRNLKQNLIKAFIRLSYMTYDTIGGTPGLGSGATGLGRSYAKLMTSAEGIEKLASALKVVKGLTPKQIYRTTLEESADKVRSIGTDTLLEGLGSLGDPVATATSFVQAAVSQSLPSAELSPEEIGILRKQHIEQHVLDDVLQESYRRNAQRRERVTELERQVAAARKDYEGWVVRERERVERSLVAACEERKQ